MPHAGSAAAASLATREVVLCERPTISENPFAGAPGCQWRGRDVPYHDGRATAQTSARTESSAPATAPVNALPA